jgi:hypothetical protein
MPNPIDQYMRNEKATIQAEEGVEGISSRRPNGMGEEKPPGLAGRRGNSMPNLGLGALGLMGKKTKGNRLGEL